ncbi:MAG: phage portal protein [Desulfovibrio sp.]|uniref:phage portal protein n=1 Tax=Desulfovibrio sp. 7SRBS1 TaxID=3378064 RepID=UPI003B420313
MKGQKRSHTTEDQAPTATAECFTFGDPEAVLDGHTMMTDLGVWLLDNGRYYNPPVSLTGIAKLLRANAYHGPILEFKTNMVMRGFTASRVLKRREMKCAVYDYLVFANTYFQCVRNYYGEVIEMRHLQAINMRRLKEPGRYAMLTISGELVEFQPDEVLHILNYDVSQKIYGLPGYLGAIQSMLLNEDATLFRRRYYKNGAHVGYIFYSSNSGLEEAMRSKIQKAIEGAKGLGNFKNMFLHIPNGAEKDIQILPVGDFSTKDDLEKIKNISRDDIIAAHRIPPALAAIIPQNMAGSFGDVTKIDQVYQRNEIMPIQEDLLEVNDVLPPAAHVSFDMSVTPLI